ncbi:MAG: hypothetical protein EXS04_07555, partial [Phycisphaerales bacterium]|nr:hypothetical protein [Phycisphaerales bacterium]
MPPRANPLCADRRFPFRAREPVPQRCRPRRCRPRRCRPRRRRTRRRKPRIGCFCKPSQFITGTLRTASHLRRQSAHAFCRRSYRPD